jgi:hypothetical protein
MLQIITEKFYPPGERYETLHRAIFYTNYRLLREEKLETSLALLRPATGFDGLAALTCEMVEKIEKHPDGPAPGVMISTGGATLLNDFAAVVSFVLNITCTPDPNLARRLLSTERPSLGAEDVPSQLIGRTFDKEVMGKASDGQFLSQFVKQLVGLKRKQFEGAMRAIRRYVMGTHRISDDLSLAYSLFVMSVESLAQKFDGHVAEWTDYEHAKRLRIDAALEGATPETAAEVRNAILANEHVAAARRFKDFALAHITPSFFRDEASRARGPINRTDLAIALQRAYSIRSGYVHTLAEVPRQLSMRGFPEAIEVEGKATLTFAGLARVARHIIMQFVERGETVEREQFDYHHAFPNIVTLPLAPEYWISQTNGFTHEHGPSRLTAFLGQWVASVLLRQPNAKVTDIRPLLGKIEEIVPSQSKASQRLPLLTIYFLFHRLIPLEERLPKFGEMERFVADFSEPSIESFVAHILTEQEPAWTLEQFEQMHDGYFKSSRSANATRIGLVLEAAFSLYLAELNRAAGNEARARDLIAFATESCPAHTALRAFEAALTNELCPRSVGTKSFYRRHSASRRRPINLRAIRMRL